LSRRVGARIVEVRYERQRSPSSGRSTRADRILQRWKSASAASSPLIGRPRLLHLSAADRPDEYSPPETRSGSGAKRIRRRRLGSAPASGSQRTPPGDLLRRGLLDRTTRTDSPPDTASDPTSPPETRATQTSGKSVRSWAHLGVDCGMVAYFCAEPESLRKPGTRARREEVSFRSRLSWLPWFLAFLRALCRVLRAQRVAHGSMGWLVRRPKTFDFPRSRVLGWNEPSPSSHERPALGAKYLDKRLLGARNQGSQERRDLKKLLPCLASLIPAS